MFGSHCGGVLVVAGLAAPIGLRTVMVLGLAASLWVQRRALAAAAGTLRIDSDGRCVLTSASGTMRGRITGAAVFPLFVRLVVRGDDRRSRTLLVMRDAVEPDGYRALRARIVQRRLPVRITQLPV